MSENKEKKLVENGSEEHVKQKCKCKCSKEHGDSAEKCEEDRFRLIRIIAGVGMAIVMIYVGLGPSLCEIAGTQEGAKEGTKLLCCSNAKVYGVQLLFWFGVFVVLSRILLFTMRDDD